MAPVAYKCGECGRVWTVDDSADEWAYGHDCEPEDDFDPLEGEPDPYTGRDE